MMILLYAVSYYLFMGLVTYLYSVFKTWEYTKVWCFYIEEKNIGIVIYPQWLLGWIHWIHRKTDTKTKRK